MTRPRSIGEALRPKGVLFIGKAQEKTSVFRTERRRNEQTGATYPWLYAPRPWSTPFYVYAWIGLWPLLPEICTYFPYNAKLCLNVTNT